MEELTQKLSEQMETMNGALEKGFTESKEVQERLVERLREVERTNRSQSETVERPKGAIASPAKSSTPSTMTTTSNTTASTQNDNHTEVTSTAAATLRHAHII